MSYKNIFISYCHKDSDVADKVQKSLYRLGINLTRDIRDLNPYGSIKDFMNRIKDGFAITIISKEYLERENCMYELTEFLKDKKRLELYKEKFIPIILDSAKKKGYNIFDTTDWVNYSNFWLKKYQNIEMKCSKRNQIANNALEDKISFYKTIIEEIPNFFSILQDCFSVSIEELETTSYNAILSKLKIKNKNLLKRLYRIARITDFEKSVLEMDKMIFKNPKESWVYFVKGNMYVEKQKIPIALENYNLAEKLDQENPWIYCNRGNCKSIIQDYKGAIDDYSNAINLQRDPLYYSLRGICRFESLLSYDKKQIDKSLTDLEIAISIDPCNANYYNNLGTINHRMTKLEEAILYYSKAIDFNPYNIDFYYNRGLARVRLGDEEQGYSDLDKYDQMIMKK